MEAKEQYRGNIIYYDEDTKEDLVMGLSFIEFYCVKDILYFETK